MDNNPDETVSYSKEQHEKFMDSIYEDLSINNPNKADFSDSNELTAFIKERLLGLEGFLNSECKEFYGIVKQLVLDNKISTKDANLLLNWYALSLKTIGQNQLETVHDIIKANGSYERVLLTKNHDFITNEFNRIHSEYQAKIKTAQKHHFFEVIACLIALTAIAISYTLSII